MHMKPNGKCHQLFPFLGGHFLFLNRNPALIWMIWMIVQPVSMIELTNKRSRATSNWTIFQPQKKEIESTRQTIFPDIFFFHGNSGKSLMRRNLYDSVATVSES